VVPGAGSWVDGCAVSDTVFALFLGEWKRKWKEEVEVTEETRANWGSGPILRIRRSRRSMSVGIRWCWIGSTSICEEVRRACFLEKNRGLQASLR
jgi:hypothetical protein